MPTNIEYFLYARKSSESEDRQVQSVEDQVNRLKELANSLGISIKEILTEAKSAKKPGREVFAELLKRIERGEAKGILCWQINRLSRNPIDSGKISWMLQQGIIHSIQTIDRQYLPDDNVLLFNVESGMANQFIIDLRKNTKRGMIGKADRGWLPSRAPIGYLNDRLEHTIYPDPDRFHLVRKMWDLMLTGNYSPPKIALIANKEWGFTTVKSKRSGGGELALSVLYKTFKSVFYTGNFEWGGKIWKGNHKPMITLEEYDRVQEILGRTAKPQGSIHEFSYTGQISCAACGSMYTANERTKHIKSTDETHTYIYYNCTRRKKGAPKCSRMAQPVMKLHEIEEQIDAELSLYTILPQFRDWALEILNRGNDKEIEDRTKIYESQHKALVDTQKELDELTKMRYRDLIDDEGFIRERDILKEKIERFKEKLRQTEHRAEKWLELTEKTFDFACYARHAFITGDVRRKRELFSALGCKAQIKGRTVVINANEWFVPIQKAYPALEAEFRRFELDKNLSTELRNERIASLILEWGG